MSETKQSNRLMAGLNDILNRSMFKKMAEMFPHKKKKQQERVGASPEFIEASGGEELLRAEEELQKAYQAEVSQFARDLSTGMEESFISGIPFRSDDLIKVDSLLGRKLQAEQDECACGDHECTMTDPKPLIDLYAWAKSEAAKHESNRCDEHERATADIKPIGMIKDASGDPVVVYSDKTIAEIIASTTLRKAAPAESMDVCQPVVLNYKDENGNPFKVRGTVSFKLKIEEPAGLTPPDFAAETIDESDITSDERDDAR